MKIFCSGIGGIGLSAYAAIRAAQGHEVSGSDRSDSDLLRDLRSQGISVSLTQDGSLLTPDTDLFVYSEAIPADAPERVRARELGIPSQSYFHALGELTKDSFLIAICGTHGKSSTTAMVARVLMEAGKDPSIVVGTKMRELDGRNWRLGKSDVFIVEACEYRRSFHFLSPDIILMTNVDGDHFDSFPTVDEYRDAFVTFLKRLPQEGVAITHGSDADCASVAAASGKQMMDADAYPSIEMAVPGAHMRDNARLALALADKLGITPDVARNSLKGFSGTWRRMEVKGDRSDGVTVIDDYAHHPAEIQATLAAMREAYPHRRIVCIFQPHTHDRTLRLYDGFIKSFAKADFVIIPDVYVARKDIETDTINIDTFVADIARESHIECVNGNGLKGTLDVLKKHLNKNNVVITMGAGSVTSLSDSILSAA